MDGVRNCYIFSVAPRALFNEIRLKMLMLYTDKKTRMKRTSLRVDAILGELKKHKLLNHGKRGLSHPPKFATHKICIGLSSEGWTRNLEVVGMCSVGMFGSCTNYVRR